MGNNTLLQEDFGAGIYRGRRAPPGSVFDAVNGLVNDEGLLFRRGGSAYYSASNAGATLTRIDALYYPGLAAPRVTMFGGTSFYALNGTTPVTIDTITGTPGRPASIAGIAVFPIAANGRLLYYGGSLKSASYATGTVSTTAGSAIVTGSGTAWLANADAGMILRHSASQRAIAVKSVDSDTQLTLVSPYPTTNAGSTLFRLWHLIDSFTVLSFAFPTLGSATYVTTAGSGLPRLLVALGNRVYESLRGDAFTSSAFDPTTYHELPSNADITGIEGIGDQAYVFTTAGLWRLDNLSLDVEDAFGNVQQQVHSVSGDVILWNDLGIASWSGAVVAPALDDVYLVSSSGVEPITRAIRPLYRSYIAAGYKPGRATIHRGHYFLPILNGTTQVDELVCRLDRPFRSGGQTFWPWTRWAGHGASLGNAAMSAAGSASKLLGINGQRVTDLTTTLDQTGNASEADATTHTFTEISNDYDLGPGIRPDTVEKVRYVYETAGGTPTFTVASAVGPEGSSYTAAVLKRGGGVSDGTDYSAWRVGRKAERVRFKFETSSAITSLILRRSELTIRQAGQT